MFIRLTETHLEMPDFPLEEGAVKLPFMRVDDGDKSCIVACLSLPAAPAVLGYAEQLLRKPSTQYMMLPEKPDFDIMSVMAFSDGRLLYCTGPSILPLEPASLPLVLSPLNLDDKMLARKTRKYELPPKVKFLLAGMEGRTQ